MIHHVLMSAGDPQRAAKAFAELDGRVTPFKAYGGGWIVGTADAVMVEVMTPQSAADLLAEVRPD